MDKRTLGSGEANRLVRGGVTEGTRTPDLRDHNLNLSSALSQLLEPKGR
jgi:hypothetical protein